jgi:hypothetical protein
MAHSPDQKFPSFHSDFIGVLHIDNSFTVTVIDTHCQSMAAPTGCDRDMSGIRRPGNNWRHFLIPNYVMITPFHNISPIITSSYHAEVQANNLIY